MEFSGEIETEEKIVKVKQEPDKIEFEEIKQESEKTEFVEIKCEPTFFENEDCQTNIESVPDPLNSRKFDEKKKQKKLISMTKKKKVFSANFAIKHFVLPVRK